MSLLTVLRSGIRTAHTITQSLQVSVTFQRFTSQDAYGKKDYLSIVRLTAIEDWKQTQVRTRDGQLATSRASVLFLDVAALVAATPEVRDSSGNLISTLGMINVNDRIGLSDGTFPPILSLSGFVDAGTKSPVVTQAFF